MKLVDFLKLIKMSFIASVAVCLMTTTGIAQAGANDFSISSYAIDYSLGRDNEMRSVLKTKETIVAQFPKIDQNHGIERAIPREYDGHPTSLDITSVTDETGKEWNYSTKSQSKLEVLRIGDSDTFVKGKKTFVIEYTQRDVTKTFANTKSDEFYWDTNGTDWRVPIDNLSVTLHIKPSIVKSLTDNAACYQGRAGSDDMCQITKSGSTFSANATDIKPGENITLSIGLEAGTFKPYAKSTFEKALGIWITLQLILSLVGAALLVWLLIDYNRKSNRSKEHDPIVAEYLPPKAASVETSGRLINTSNTFAAQLIDLAVRRYLKIYQTKQKKGLFGSRQYEYNIEIVRDIKDLLTEEQEFLNDIFKNKTIVGTVLEMKDLKKDTGLYTRLADNPKKLRKLIRNKYKLRHKVPAQSVLYSRLSYGLLVVAIVLLSPALLIVAMATFIAGRMFWTLTEKGLALVRHLKGLKLYIKVAEHDRLKMLQSPEGAAKVKIDTDDDTQLVKLYERVLPYAILFGEEKEWNKQLGKYYERSGTQPDWYAGAAGATFSAASFSSAITSFSSSATSSSSSSGGSGGGGYSGGGGGGGGGGGW